MRHLRQPLPWAADTPGATANYAEPTDGIDTEQFCGFILASIILGCIVAATLIISRQNRLTR